MLLGHALLYMATLVPDYFSYKLESQLMIQLISLNSSDWAHIQEEKV